jgi:molybdate transport repressor ModE-like protein
VNVRFLSTFRIVAETGSLKAAARHLGLSSTSVSDQIRALEQALDTRLISRHGHGILLTEAGHAVLPAVRQVLEHVDELRQIAQLGQPRGPLRAGAAPTAIVSILPPALKHMAHHYPKIDLRVYPGSSTYLYERIEGGDLDCMISTRPQFALPKTMIWYPVRREPLLLLCPRDLDGEDIGSLLTTAPFIRMDRHSWTGQLVTRFLEDQAIWVKELFEMDAPQAIVILVAQGIGVTLLPDWGIEEPAGSRIRRVPVGDPSYDREVGVIGIRGARERLIEGLVAALRANTESTMPT